MLQHPFAVTGTPVAPLRHPYSRQRLGLRQPSAAFHRGADFQLGTLRALRATFFRMTFFRHDANLHDTAQKPSARFLWFLWFRKIFTFDVFYPHLPSKVLLTAEGPVPIAASRQNVETSCRGMAARNHLLRSRRFL
jgi:hypothetical protein